MDRLEVANAAAAIFIADTTLEVRDNRVCVSWTTYRGERFSYRWMCRGQDFFPVWYHKWAHGGTCCTALAQLVRWVSGQPILPLLTWEYWCSPNIWLAHQRGNELIGVLRNGGYPESVSCVLCGRENMRRFDWWSRKVSGPCCLHYDQEGCRQQPNEGK